VNQVLASFLTAIHEVGELTTLPCHLHSDATTDEIVLVARAQGPGQLRVVLQFGASPPFIGAIRSSLGVVSPQVFSSPFEPALRAQLILLAAEASSLSEDAPLTPDPGADVDGVL